MRIETFLASLETALGDYPQQKMDLLEEVRGHLEDAARDLQLAGWNVVASEEEAVRRCGRPEDIVDAIRAGRGRIFTRRHSRAVFAGAVVSATLLCFSGRMVAAAVIPHPGVERTTNEQTINRGSCQYGGSHPFVVPGAACGGRTATGAGGKHAANPPQR